MATPSFAQLPPRDTTDSSQVFLKLVADPFDTHLSSKAVLVALGTSLAFTSATFLGFCLLRPFRPVVYAPRLRVADPKYAPPSIGTGFFAWLKPIMNTHEDALVHQIGLDATIFLRFTKMCRNIFSCLGLAACAVLLPINIVNGNKFYKQWPTTDALVKMTPSSLNGNIFWAFVLVAYVFDIVICGFLWWNYRAVLRLRRAWMDSPAYQHSLHARTLMVTNIPAQCRSDSGIQEIVDAPHPSIGRNVKDLPELIEDHDKKVMRLEQALAKYLKHPDRLPEKRPTCHPSRKDADYPDKKQKVDEIDYLTDRIQRLESDIYRIRNHIDTRGAMPYGFASFDSVDAAHHAAYAAAGKHPKGTKIQLAPQPKDIIWQNLRLDPKTRRWRRFINNVWIAVLTALWFVPNALIAVFLSNLNNLGNVWPGFQTELKKNPNFWAVVQGIAAPAITSLFYYCLPIIFRRIRVQAGDVTKTSRERHVIHGLYAFFVVNNLVVFSLFSAFFGFVSSLISEAKSSHVSFMDAVRDNHPVNLVMTTLCNVSPFWITWLLQRNLGAAIDLAQVVNLTMGPLKRKFGNPTPRELVKLTAPPPFDYASYYNYFLFYSTVALGFATLQPLTLVVTALYFSSDAVMKKYLLMYVFVTKTESGGLYWRVLFNRFLVGTFLSNLVVALLVVARGYSSRWVMLAAMIPLPLLLVGFKLYCKKTFDPPYYFYTKGVETAEAAMAHKPRSGDGVAKRFGHPALSQDLITPTLYEGAEHAIAKLFKRLYPAGLDDASGGHSFSDAFSMRRMDREKPGKAAGSGPGGFFDFVSDVKLDFLNFRGRPGFAAGDEAGDAASAASSRPGTPMAGRGRALANGSRSASQDSLRKPDPDETVYPVGYHSARDFSPSRTSDRSLLGAAAPMSGR